MRQYTVKYIKMALAALVLIGCLCLVVAGHRMGSTASGLGAGGLVMELVGLAGVLTLLGLYNHSSK